jgi:hypothetical protein
MTRKEMIGRLVELSVTTATTEPRHLWLSNIFENGFAGYSKFSERRLLMELQLRGLAPSEEAAGDEAGEDADPDVLGLAFSGAPDEGFE